MSDDSWPIEKYMYRWGDGNHTKIQWLKNHHSPNRSPKVLTMMRGCCHCSPSRPLSRTKITSKRNLLSTRAKLSQYNSGVGCLLVANTWSYKNMKPLQGILDKRAMCITRYQYCSSLRMNKTGYPTGWKDTSVFNSATVKIYTAYYVSNDW